MSDGLRVLVVSPYPPSRLAGGPIRLHGLITGLPARHAVSLVAFARRGQDGVPPEVRERCEDVVIVPNERREMWSGKAVDYA